jgi:hypothetical protein
MTSSLNNMGEAAKRRLAYQQKIKEESEKSLKNMTEIRRQNSNVSVVIYLLYILLSQYP